MSRVEEVSQGNYVKLPDKTQRELMEVVNKYFMSDMVDISNSKEGMILEIQQRLKPLVVNLVRNLTIREGSEIITPIVNERVDQAMKEFMASLDDIVKDLKEALGTNGEFVFKVTSDTMNVPVATATKFKASLTTVIVTLNGMVQNESDNYTKIIGSDGDIVGIRFNDVLNAPDVVKVIFLAQGGTS